MLGTRFKVAAGLFAVAVGLLATAVPAQAVTVPVGSVAVTPSNLFSNSNDKPNQKAVCPVGAKIVGGGATITSSTGHVIITESKPVTSKPADFWTATAIEDTVGEPANWGFQVFAYCATGTLPGYEIITSAPNNAPANTPFLGISAHCTGNKQVLGSGGTITGGANQVSLSTIGDQSGSFDTSATAAGTADFDGYNSTWSVTSYVVCVTTANFQDVVQAKAASATAGVPAVAACPTGYRATGGAGWADTPSTVVGITPNSTTTPNAVTVAGVNTHGSTASVTATVWCAI